MARRLVEAGVVRGKTKGSLTARVREIHDGVADVVTDGDLEREVLAPKRRMDAATGQSAPAFVWLHGTPFGASPRHDAAVREAGYRYQFANTAVQRIA